MKKTHIQSWLSLYRMSNEFSKKKYPNKPMTKCEEFMKCKSHKQKILAFTAGEIHSSV